MTRFTLWSENGAPRMRELPVHKLRSIRKLGFKPQSVPREEWTGTGSLQNFFLSMEQLRLDELVIFWWFPSMNQIDVRFLVLFLRRLRHVRTVKIVLYRKKEEHTRREYCSLVGAIMKEDHFQRYDAPGAPNLEATWWDWYLDTQQNVITFQAQEPRPVLAEEEYMLIMKPKVDALMVEAEHAAAL
jgi:hypothetical protein